MSLLRLLTSSTTLPANTNDLTLLITRAANRWNSVSSDEMLARAKSIAAGLHAIGVVPGDRVAILSESRVEWTLTDAGSIFAGTIDVPIYPTLMPPQVRYILNDSGACILFLANREKFDELKDALGECPQVKHIIFFDTEGVTDAEGLTLAQLEEKGRELEHREPGHIDQSVLKTKPDDLATIIYTSGTTGEPKGVMLTHSNLVSNLIDSSGHLSFGEHDIALSVLPLSHVFERQAMYMYLHQGMAVYFAESLQTIGPNLREVSPTVLVGVPRIFEKIYARIRERAAEAGKVSAALLAWSVSVAREYAKYVIAHEPVPAFLKLQASDRVEARIFKMAVGIWRAYATVGVGRRGAAGRSSYIYIRRRHSDRSGLWSDGNFAGHHHEQDRRHSPGNSRHGDSQC